MPSIKTLKNAFYGVLSLCNESPYSNFGLEHIETDGINAGKFVEKMVEYKEVYCFGPLVQFIGNHNVHRYCHYCGEMYYCYHPTLLYLLLHTLDSQLSEFSNDFFFLLE